MKLLALLISTTIILSFSLKKEHVVDNHPQLLQKTATDTVGTTPGEVLIEQYCYTCHSPQMRGQQRLAPPFQMVKMHYMRDYSSREEFTDAISAWVKNPGTDRSIMPGALNRFGLMPPMMIEDKDLKLIAEYLYDADLPDFRGRGNGRMHRRHGRGN